MTTITTVEVEKPTLPSFKRCFFLCSFFSSKRSKQSLSSVFTEGFGAEAACRTRVTITWWKNYDGEFIYQIEISDTAISRMVVGKSARDNPERYCGWFWVLCSSRKFKIMAREAMEICLLVPKESSKSRFDSYCVRNSVLIISHITFRDCRVRTFSVRNQSNF